MNRIQIAERLTADAADLRDRAAAAAREAAYADDLRVYTSESQRARTLAADASTLERAAVIVRSLYVSPEA